MELQAFCFPSYSFQCMQNPIYHEAYVDPLGKMREHALALGGLFTFLPFAASLHLFSPPAKYLSGLVVDTHVGILYVCCSVVPYQLSYCD